MTQQKRLGLRLVCVDKMSINVNILCDMSMKKYTVWQKNV